MMQSLEAVYSQGTLTLSEPLDLPDRTRVQITIEPIEQDTEQERLRKAAELVSVFKESRLRFGGKMPSRDELHDRV